jgi:hypothetical protein
VRGESGQLRCSAPAVTAGAAFSRWLLRRGTSPPPPSPAAGLRAAGEVLLGAPRLSVELTSSPSGELIREYMLARRRGIRSHLRARSVLRIPPQGTPMLSGRRFHAARTNVARARQEGIACRELPEPERPGALRELGVLETMLRRKTDRWWVAEAADRTTVGVALATVDHGWAMLNVLDAPQYPARYLLHSHVVCALRAAGVRYLTARGPSALVMPEGLLYLQARLGYEVVNLRVRDGR